MNQETYLNDLRDNMVRRNRDKWQPVTGPRREGKTTLAVGNAFWVYPKFDIDRHLVFTTDDLIDVGLNSEPGTALILDEPIDGMLSFDANTTSNKSLYRAATIMGERNLYVQFCIPSLKRLTKAFREDYCSEENHVLRRGVAQLRRITDPKTNEMIDPPKVVDQFDYAKMPPVLETRYEVRKTDFVQRHRDVDGYDQVRITERQMEARLAPVLRRHGIQLEPRAVEEILVKVGAARAAA